MTYLDRLENHSIYVLREAHARIDRPALLWSIGKDSNTLVWLMLKAFYGRVPCPAVHVDTGLEFPEVYALRDRLAREWNLDFIAAPCPPIESMDQSLPPAARSASRKTVGLADAIRAHGFTGIITGIRRDEQSTRAKERIFSPRGPDGQWLYRDQPPELWDLFALEPPPGGHLRVHPLLHWTEADVWRYVEREGIPVSELYFAKDGKRFRSLGESDITRPIASNADTVAAIIAELDATREPERAGRTMDHETEDAFERLRVAGYL